MSRVAAFLFAVVMLCAGNAWAQVESRIALVVGNGAYQNIDPLRNPVNDARAMAKALGDAGFEVIFVENATRRSLTNALREFSGKLTPGGVGLFYYAGHGMQVRGANYLLPVDATLSTEDELRYETIDLNDVLGRFDEARTRLSLVILDACRDNPFAKRFRSTSRGLAQTDAPRGTVIAYATAPGDTAADGDGTNGLYTTELLKAMVVPGLQLEEVFKRTIDGVARASNSKQTPWVSSSFRGAFYFHAAAAGSTPAPAAAAPPPTAQPADLELAAWNAIATSNNPAMFELFLKRYPNGHYADFARARLEELKAAEARTAAAEEAKRKATADEAKRKADVDAAKRVAAADEARRKADADEAKRKADADAEAKRVAAADEARRKADADAKRTVNVPAAGLQRFDGSWSSQLTCDSVPNGPAGYTWAVLLQVRNGEITGQRLNDQGSRLTFKGRIEPDGSAKIAVEGTSGDAKYNAGNAPKGSPVSFTMAVQFADRDARGTRIGTRPCTIVMKR